MSATSDDALLDGLAGQPDAQPNPNRASLLVDGAPPSIDSGGLLYLLARRVGQLRDLLALARQKNLQQDARLDAIEARLTKGGL